MGQDKGDERRQVDDQGCPRGVGPSEPGIEQGQLNKEDDGKGQQGKQMFPGNTQCPTG